MKPVTNEEIKILRNEINAQVHEKFEMHYEVDAALDRLEELEAKEHERRWRKIAVEGLPKVKGEYQFKGGQDTVIIDWGEKTTSYEDMKWVKHNATHWRPQDTDLPEAEIDSAATISENKT